MKSTELKKVLIDKKLLKRSIDRTQKFFQDNAKLLTISLSANKSAHFDVSIQFITNFYA